MLFHSVNYNSVALKKDGDRRIDKVNRFRLGDSTAFIQFLAALAVLPRTILNNRMNFTRMI